MQSQLKIGRLPLRVRPRPVWCAAVLACLLLAGSAAPAEEARPAFFLHPRDVVVFLGDSITERGLFIGYLDEYLLTHFPSYRVRLINAGWGGDRVTFGGEGSHSPGALGRLERDVLARHPTVVVVMLGMNDGREGVRDPARLPQFRDGIREIVRRIRRRCHARVVLLTTTPYDAKRRPESYQGYNDSLSGYARAVLEIGRAEGVLAVDLYTPMTRLLAHGQRCDPAFTLMPDGMHPSALGHRVILGLLLRAWHAPLEERRLVLDAGGQQTRCHGCVVRRLSGNRTVLSFERRLAALPIPLDEGERAALAGDPVYRALCGDGLVAHGLSALHYELRADGQPLAIFSRARLASGVDISRCLGSPDLRQARTAVGAAREGFDLRQAAWRAEEWRLAKDAQSGWRRLGDALGHLFHRGAAEAAPPPSPLPDLPQRLERLERAARAAALPRWHRFELIAVR